MHVGPGATVSVANLFERVPVRKEMMAEQIDKAVKLVYQLFTVYALQYPRVSFVLECKTACECVVWPASSTRAVVVVVVMCFSCRATGAPMAPFRCDAGQLRAERCTAIFGPKHFSELRAFRFQHAERMWDVAGLLCAPDRAVYASTLRSRGDRQFVYLNGRPIVCKSVTKAVNRVFRAHANVASGKVSVFLSSVACDDVD